MPFILKEPALKKQYGNNADKNGGISNVENRAEKQKVIATYNGNPLRPIEVKKAERKAMSITCP